MILLSNYHDQNFKSSLFKKKNTCSVEDLLSREERHLRNHLFVPNHNQKPYTIRNNFIFNLIIQFFKKNYADMKRNTEIIYWY
jgi:hypothetical protein